jgi:hypothetical protein
VRWLAEGAAAAVAGALREAAPELAGLPIVMAERVGQTDSRWWASSAIIGGRFVAKFAWSQIAARRLRHEIAVLAALHQPATRALVEAVAGELRRARPGHDRCAAAGWTVTGSWPGICAAPSATSCGAARPASTWPTTGPRNSGSTTWPSASVSSASIPSG